MTAFHVLNYLADDARAWVDLNQFIPGLNTGFSQCYKLFVVIRESKGL